MPTPLGRIRSAASTTIEEFVSVCSGGKTKRLTLVFVSNTATPNRRTVLFLRQGYKAISEAANINIIPMKRVRANTEIPRAQSCMLMYYRALCVILLFRPTYAQYVNSNV